MLIYNKRDIEYILHDLNYPKCSCGSHILQRSNKNFL